MALAVSEVLALWREGERLLEELPHDSPDRAVIAFEVVRLRNMYRRLTSEGAETWTTIGASQVSIEDSARILAAAKQRLGLT